MKKERKRFQFKFWLDVVKPGQMALAERLDELRPARQFAPTVRNALRLFFDLSDGKTDVLKEIFPWVLEVAQDTPERATTGNVGDSGDGGQDDALKTLQATITSQQRTIDHLSTLIENPKYHAPVDTEPRQLPARASTAKTYTEPEIEITGKAKTSENANYNMLIASASMGMCKLEELPPEVIAYGVERGKISPDKLPKVDSKPAKKADPPKNEIKQIAGAALAFDAPAFDDLELTI